MAEFWAAIVGAIVGGVIAAAIQALTLNHQSNEDQKRRREQNQILGRGLIFKLMRITSDFHSIQAHLDESASGVYRTTNAEPWTYVLPIANLPTPIKFTADEASAVMTQNAAIANDLLDLESIHASTLRTLSAYSDLRQRLSEQLPGQTFEGAVGTLELDAKTISVVRPKMIELNSILNALIERNSKDFERSWKTLQTVNTILKKQYGLDLKLSINTPPNSPP